MERGIGIKKYQDKDYNLFDIDKIRIDEFYEFINCLILQVISNVGQNKVLLTGGIVLDLFYNSQRMSKDMDYCVLISKEDLKLCYVNQKLSDNKFKL